MTKRRVFFYVQHLLGIGHLVRATRIADALVAAGLDVTIAMGGPPVTGFPGPGIRIIQLPAVKAGKAGFSVLEDPSGNAVDTRFKTIRVHRLLAAFQEWQPDALVIEAFPFGRRVMRFELLPLLDATLAMPRRPLVASSVRDILQEKTKPGRAEETAEAIEKYFDMVLVHGDPAFAQFKETFPLANAISKKICYTGLVAGPVPKEPTDRFDIVISAGGGAAGLPLVRAATEMIAQYSDGLRCCLITGLNIQQSEFSALMSRRIPGLEIYAFRPDLPSLLLGTRLSISQAGYNTVCDILRAGCRSLLIPYATGGETEQSARAERLATMGLAAVLPEEGINAKTLFSAVERLLAMPRPSANALDLEGAQHTAEILRARLPT